MIELHRRADLLDPAVLQHDDAVGERHRLDLVVGDIDHRRRGHALLELGDLDAGGDAKRGVEVRQRLVEQEHLRVAHDGAADGDALALAARHRLGQAVEKFGELQDLGGLANAPVDLGLAFLGDLHAEGHVVVDGHMRIERIGLEHHGDAALRRRHVVDHLAGDLEFAGGDLLEPGDGPQQRRLSAARRADEDDELARFDVEVDAVQNVQIAVGLLDLPEGEIGHVFLPKFLFPAGSGETPEPGSVASKFDRAAIGSARKAVSGQRLSCFAAAEIDDGGLIDRD